MENFTPLKPVEKKKKRINKFLIFGNLFLVVLVALIGIFYYNNVLLPQQQKAGEQGCNQYDNRKDCIANCSPPKSNDIRYKCKWHAPSNSCHDSENWCGTGGNEPANCGSQTDAQKACNDPEGTCCVPAGTSTGIPNCQGIGPRYTVCEQGYECMQGYGCFPPVGPTEPPNPTKTPTPTPPTATNTPTPTPTQPSMSVCNETCSSSDLCFNEEPGPNELVCTAVGGGVSRCRNKACVTSSTCVCPTSTPTPTRTPTPTPTGTLTPTPTGTLTPTPTGTLTPTPTPTTPVDEPTNTPIPVLCGTKDCDNATNPCRSGYDCVQANDGSNYCTSPDFTDACKANPSYNSCCIAPGEPTATPTEIILAQTTVTSPPVPVTSTTAWWIYIIPALIIFGGLIL